LKISVVGPGAIGCLFAAILAKNGHHVWLLDHCAERAKFLEAQGVYLHDQQGQRLISMRATADPTQIGTVELIFLCVKSDAVLDAARGILPLLGPNSLLIALQNGIAHHHLLTEMHPKWVLGITAQGATLLGPGSVRHGGFGHTSVGFLDDSDTLARHRLQDAVKVMNCAGLSTTFRPDILAVAWNKLIINAGINALTALEGCANGQLLARPAALATLKAAVREAAQVALACGIQVTPDPVALTVGVCLETAENISSMLQDIRQRRHTEVEAINGMIVRQAAEFGIAVPTNQALLAGVKALETKN
jgi:2-dehydropantoate 2-reductase